MASNKKKLSQIAVVNSASSSDRVPLVKDPNGTSSTRTITIENLFGNSSANTKVQYITPANSTITVARGTIFVDNTYIYVATSDNILKRVNLSSF